MRQQVNLLSDELKPRSDPLQFKQLLLAWAGFSFLLILMTGWDGAGLWMLNAEQEQASERLGQLRRVNADLQATTRTTPDAGLQEEVDELRARQAEQIQLLALLAGYGTGETTGFSSYLNDLADHRVNGLWLSRIVLEESGRRIRLKGLTTDPVNLPVFLQGLSAGESFRGHQFDDFGLQEVESGLLEFDIAGPEEDA